MFTNITRVISALKILKETIPQRDAGGRIEIYTAVLVLTNGLRRNLDPEFIHHNYTRQNLSRVEDAFAALCGFVQLGGHNDVNWDAYADQLGSSLLLLSLPERWPSKCDLIDENGNEVCGTNPPKA